MSARHTRWMRRTALVTCLVGAAILVAGWLAIGAAGDSAPVHSSSKSSSSSSEAVGSAKLPPLPSKLRPKVVQPEAGSSSSTDAETESVTDPGLTDAGPAPKAPASTGGRRLNGVLRDAGGGVNKATALSNGVALPPLEAPEAVRQIIEAGNSIARAPYKWGGGHGRLVDRGYDCSGAVSYGLIRTTMLRAPMVSGSFARWGAAGAGRWVSVYANAGHVYLEVAGLRLDTSAVGDHTGRTGVRWRPAIGRRAGFAARHPAGL